MLFIILLFLVLSSAVLLALKKDVSAILMLLLNVSLAVMMVGITVYAAKTGGLRRPQKVFLFLSADIQRWLSYLIYPLGDLGYTIAVGRYAFPTFLLMLSLHYSMVSFVRKMRKWQPVVWLLPAASLMVYYPRIFHQVVRNRFALQRFLMAGTVIWILLYLILAVVLLLHEYRSITMPYYRRQFRFILIAIACLVFLYCLFGFQDPIQVYQLYSVEYLWFNGMSYANPNLPMSAWVVITALTILCTGLGFWNLRGYSQLSTEQNSEDVRLQRKFDTASTGASIFVHSIKNQLLATRVAQKKLRQSLSEEPLDPEKLSQQLRTLEHLNEGMLSHMEELYKSVKSKSISLTPTPVADVAEQTLRRFHDKYPDAEVKLRIATAPKEQILADEAHLSSAVYNLLINGQEAILSAGRENGELSLVIHDERLYIVFEVRDNGCGIPKNAVRSIYDPFYTSKNSNVNWGMGLYYIRQIAKAHAGMLRMETQVGVGTAFFLMIPRYQPRVAKGGRR